MTGRVSCTASISSKASNKYSIYQDQRQDLRTEWIV